MYGRRRARGLLAVLVLVSLVLITIDFRSPAGQGPLDRVREVATAVFSPIQDGLATLLRPVGNALGDVSNLFNLRAENARLRGRLDDLEDRNVSFEELERENRELRELLGLRDRAGYEVIAAETIALAPSNYEWTITINVGSSDGIERDMVVVNRDGLVGRVIQVTPTASRVLLAIDLTFSAAVRLPRTGETGWLDGRGGDLLQLGLLKPTADVQVGDEVVTSSYSNSVFPPGIPIGTVDAVGAATSVLTREIGVRPYVDFTRLSHVLVIIHAPVPELPPVTTDPDVPFTPPSPRTSPSPTPSPTGSPTEAAP